MWLRGSLKKCAPCFLGVEGVDREVERLHIRHWLGVLWWRTPAHGSVGHSWQDEWGKYLGVAPASMSHREGKALSAGCTHQQSFLFPLQYTNKSSHFQKRACWWGPGEVFVGYQGRARGSSRGATGAPPSAWEMGAGITLCMKNPRVK